MSSIVYILLWVTSSPFSCTSLYNEPDYSVDNIHPELKENAFAVVRSYSETFEIKSKARAVMSLKYAITVLDKNGDRYVEFNPFYDQFRKITNIKATIYDQSGERIEKVKNTDIKDYSDFASFSLYSDNRQKYYKPQIKDYPFTVEYEYEIEFDGLLTYSRWYPVPGYDVSVEKSSFEMIIPRDMSFRFQAKNLDRGPTIVSLENSNVYTWEISNIPAMESEAHSPYFAEICPSVITAPDEFEMDGCEGNMSSWQQFGLWTNNLLKGRDIIPEETKNELDHLIEGLSSERDITKKVYEFVQSRTRYISIQEGIGGWQPFAAADVNETGYGDCKALSNYTMALLKSVGIKSFYTKVKAGSNTANMNTDFVCNQSNHVILTVPFERDTIWLECTSQTNPFGYIGNFTDDRDVLLITNQGGEIVHTIVYRQEDNCQHRKAEVLLTADGSGNATVSTCYTGLQFDNVSGVLEESYEEQEKWLYRNIDIANFDIIEFGYTVDGDVIPVATEELKLKLNNYASVLGKRLFVPLNLMNSTDYIPPKIKNRKTEVVLRMPFVDVDTVVFQLPLDFKIESKPENTNYACDFGEYSSTIHLDTDKVIYVRSRKMNKGCFPAERYEDFIEFYKSMVKADKAELVLVREE